MATIPQDARGDARAAPKLGQHTDEVLADVLSLDGGEIARLHDQGVVAGPQA
jgi:2-methylfumaryl-CoA isomerase